MTVKEAATLLKVGTATIRRYVRVGVIKTTGRGRHNAYDLLDESVRQVVLPGKGRRPAGPVDITVLSFRLTQQDCSDLAAIMEQYRDRFDLLGIVPTATSIIRMLIRQAGRAAKK